MFLPDDKFNCLWINKFPLFSTDDEGMLYIKHLYFMHIVIYNGDEYHCMMYSDVCHSSVCTMSITIPLWLVPTCALYI